VLRGEAFTPTELTAFTISRYVTNWQSIPWRRISAASGSIPSPYTSDSMSQVGGITLLDLVREVEE
jgi:hypothetical protein